MSVPKNLLYTKSHEWVKLFSNGGGQIGITDHAQEAMGELVFVELPQVGDVISKGKGFAVVESVKATSDVFAPISGRISVVNSELEDEPGKVNEDCYSAWLVEMEQVSDTEELLTPEEYEEVLKAEEE